LPRLQSSCLGVQPGQVCTTPGKLVIRYSSRVVSLVMYRRPLESKANPVGRKQPPGHFELSRLDIIVVPARGLLSGSALPPKSTRTTRYPSGGERSLLINQDVLVRQTDCHMRESNQEEGVLTNCRERI
jgi:hypothetical protein